MQNKQKIGVNTIMSKAGNRDRSPSAPGQTQKPQGRCRTKGDLRLQAGSF